MSFASAGSFGSLFSATSVFSIESNKSVLNVWCDGG